MKMANWNIEIGKKLVLSVDFDRLAKADKAMHHAIYIGLRNILQDSHANATRADFPTDEAYKEASLVLATNKLEALYNNDISRRRAASVPTDPIGREALRLARVKLGEAFKGWQTDNADARAYLVECGEVYEMPTSTIEELKDVYDEALDRYAAKPEVRETAETNLAKLKKIGAPNLRGLGLI
jgi:hypothetical protein